jgi:hypothetical protein
MRSQQAFALYQGTTLVVPRRRKREGFSPCAFFHWDFLGDFTVAGAKALAISVGDGTTEVVP